LLNTNPFINVNFIFTGIPNNYLCSMINRGISRKTKNLSEYMYLYSIMHRRGWFKINW